MTPATLQMHREEYRKRLLSGLQWKREPTPQGYYHIPFDARKFLAKFSENEAAAIVEGMDLPKEYRKEKKFVKLRNMLDKLSPEDIIKIFATYAGEG